MREVYLHHGARGSVLVYQKVLGTNSCMSCSFICELDCCGQLVAYCTALVIMYIVCNFKEISL